MLIHGIAYYYHYYYYKIVYFQFVNNNGLDLNAITNILLAQVR